MINVKNNKIGNLKVYGIVYKITNKINGMVYIGQTTNKIGFNGRYSCGNVGKYTDNEHLRNAISKYGIENFDICKIFDIAFSKEELNIKEQCWISTYKACDRKYGYNYQIGGNNSTLSKDSLKRFREIRGSSVICVTTNKVFDSVTEASKYYNINYTRLCACCRKKSGHCGMLNDVIPLKWLFYDDYKNMSKQDIKYFINDSTNDCITRKIICMNDKNIFNNSKEASIFYKCDSSCILKVCKGNKKSIKGYTFMYYNDYIKLSKEEKQIKYINNYRPQNIKIICLNDKRIFNSIGEASRYYNVNSGDISRICSDKHKTSYAKGYSFMYYDDYIV